MGEVGKINKGRLIETLVLRKRARVSLTLRLICGYLLRSLLPFLTCIYETLLDSQEADRTHHEVPGGVPGRHAALDGLCEV